MSVKPRIFLVERNFSIFCLFISETGVTKTQLGLDISKTIKHIHQIFGVCMACIISRLRHTQKKEEKMNCI